MPRAKRAVWCSLLTRNVMLSLGTGKEVPAWWVDYNASEYIELYGAHCSAAPLVVAYHGRVYGFPGQLDNCSRWDEMGVQYAITRITIVIPRHYRYGVVPAWWVDYNASGCVTDAQIIMLSLGTTGMGWCPRGGLTL